MVCRKGGRQVGIRFRIAFSYVIISALAVLVVEVVLAIIVSTDVGADQQSEKLGNQFGALTGAQNAAHENATALGLYATRAAAQQPSMTDQALLADLASKGAAHTDLADGISGTQEATDLGLPAPAVALADLSGHIVKSSPGSGLDRGTPLPVTGTGTSGTVVDNGRFIGWAVEDVNVLRPGRSTGAPQAIGRLYVRLPLLPSAANEQALPPASPSRPTHGVRSLIVPSLIVLLLLCPVGALFGILVQRRLVSRIRRLVTSTGSMAGGDLATRIPVSGTDEIGRLEDGFNQMAERLEEASRAEREGAALSARQAERSRIAHELHDSVSQDMFSLSMLAGGVRRALPEGSLREQVQVMEEVVDHTMREMRALLLELRPVDLCDDGLGSTLTELFESYEERLGIRVLSDLGELGEVALDPAVEHGMLRIVQEAVGNAARHGGATAIGVTAAETEGCITMEIIDNGRGFDTTRSGRGMGLTSMRERVSGLGGSMEISSAAGSGTSVRVTIPTGAK
jgi:signal transduction histidine kinase